MPARGAEFATLPSRTAVVRDALLSAAGAGAGAEYMEVLRYMRLRQARYVTGKDDEAVPLIAPENSPARTVRRLLFVSPHFSAALPLFSVISSPVSAPFAPDLPIPADLFADVVLRSVSGMQKSAEAPSEIDKKRGRKQDDKASIAAAVEEACIREGLEQEQREELRPCLRCSGRCAAQLSSTPVTPGNNNRDAHGKHDRRDIGEPIIPKLLFSERREETAAAPKPQFRKSRGGVDNIRAKVEQLLERSSTLASTSTAMETSAFNVAARSAGVTAALTAAGQYTTTVTATIADNQVSDVVECELARPNPSSKIMKADLSKAGSSSAAHALVFNSADLLATSEQGSTRPIYESSSVATQSGYPSEKDVQGPLVPFKLPSILGDASSRLLGRPKLAPLSAFLPSRFPSDYREPSSLLIRHTSSAAPAELVSSKLPLNSGQASSIASAQKSNSVTNASTLVKSMSDVVNPSYTAGQKSHLSNLARMNPSVSLSGPYFTQPSKQVDSKPNFVSNAVVPSWNRGEDLDQHGCAAVVFSGSRSLSTVAAQPHLPPPTTHEKKVVRSAPKRRKKGAPPPDTTSGPLHELNSSCPSCMRMHNGKFGNGKFCSLSCSKTAGAKARWGAGATTRKAIAQARGEAQPTFREAVAARRSGKRSSKKDGLSRKRSDSCSTGSLRQDVAGDLNPAPFASISDVPNSLGSKGVYGVGRGIGFCDGVSSCGEDEGSDEQCVGLPPPPKKPCTFRTDVGHLDEQHLTIDQGLCGEVVGYFWPAKGTWCVGVVREYRDVDDSHCVEEYKGSGKRRWVNFRSLDVRFPDSLDKQGAPVSWSAEAI